MRFDATVESPLRADVAVWQAANRDGHPYQDAWLVLPGAEVLRIAVVDGVTPHVDGGTHGGADSAVYGAGVLRAALHDLDQSIETGARAANDHLVDPEIGNTRARPQAAFAAVDLDQQGRLVGARGADCEVWVRRGGAWESLTPGDMLTPAGRAVAIDWAAANDGTVLQDWVEPGSDHYGDPSLWHTTAIGRFTDPKLESVSAEGVEAVVVASDGALLDADRVAHLEEWMTMLLAEQHDDATAVRVLRQQHSR